MTNHWKIYFLQMLDWFDRLDTELVCALLDRWPALKELQNVPPAKLRTFFREHHCGREELVEGHLIGIRQAIAAILDRAVIEPKSTVVKVSAQPIRTLVRVFADLGRKIEEAAAHPDFSFLSHYPEQRWRLACWQRLARSESGMATIGKCNRTVGSPR